MMNIQNIESLYRTWDLISFELLRLVDLLTKTDFSKKYFKSAQTLCCKYPSNDIMHCAVNIHFPYEIYIIDHPIQLKKNS